MNADEIITPKTGIPDPIKPIGSIPNHIDNTRDKCLE
jgi:hypothetical protein